MITLQYTRISFHYEYASAVMIDLIFSHQLIILSIIPTVKDLLGIWKQRNLTIAGKIQVFKSLIFSKLVYVATKNAVLKTITD